MSRLATLKEYYCTDIAKMINEYCMPLRKVEKQYRWCMHKEIFFKTEGIKNTFMNHSQILKQLEAFNWEVHVDNHICRFQRVKSIPKKHCRYCIIERIKEKKKKTLADIVRLSELKRGLYREIF
jgi:hypothetical protein